MDNLTHSLVGIASAKAGLEKLSPAVTTLCVLAANAPDADIVVLLFGDRWTLLQHHRGITHALVGTLVFALVLPAVFYLSDVLISRIRKQPRRLVFKGLLISSLVVSATHPLLDWTNNYGIRFFLPWNARWFYGDLVFIVDPFIWLILGSACFLLTTRTRFMWMVWSIVGLILTLLIFLSARAANLSHPWLIRSVWLIAIVSLTLLAWKGVAKRSGQRIASGSLVAVVLYWGILGTAHSFALARAKTESVAVAREGELISRIAAMPTLANPLSWDCVFETDKATYRFNLVLGDTQITNPVRYEKPVGKVEKALQEVSNDRRTQVFLGFARFPVAKLADPNCTSQTLVQLADLRYTEPGTSRGSFSLEVPVDCPTQLSFDR